MTMVRMAGHPNFILREMQKMARKEGWEFESSPEKFYPHNEWNSALVTLYTNNGAFKAQLQQMPGCCAVLTASYINTDAKMPFKRAVEIISQAAKDAGFGSVVLTQVWHMPQLKDNRWATLTEIPNTTISEPFVNAKSGNCVSYITIDLKQPGQIEGFEF